MIYVISYDISSDRLRTKVAKLLEGYGVRVQYSVFECRITVNRFNYLYKQIVNLTGKKEETCVRIYSLCENCEQKIVTIGKPLGELASLDTDVVVI